MRTKSRIKPDLTLDDVVFDMVACVVNNEVRNPPYISLVSKRQIWNGAGYHWKNEERYIKAGLMQNAGIRIPKDSEIDKKNRFYGYEALQKPWRALNNLSNRVLRKGFILKQFDGEKFEDIRILLGRGYIRADGTLDPDQTKGISVYVLFLANPKRREDQNEWLQDQPKWARFQVARNQYTHMDVIAEKLRAANKTVRDQRKLTKFLEWQDLDPAVDPNEYTWGEDD